MRLPLRLAVSASLAAWAIGCSGAAEQLEPGPAPPPDLVERAVSQALTPLGTRCTFNDTTGVMNVTVAAGETAIISRRIADSAIVENGLECDKPATAATLKKLTIVGSGGDETVIVDYSNGPFATGTASATSGISVDMRGGTGHGNDRFGFRGTAQADAVALGALGVALNADAFRDLTFVGSPERLVFSLGDGNDTWTAAGGTALGVGTTYVAGVPITVWGGAGADTFSQGGEVTAGETLYGGAGTDTVTYALRGALAPVTVTAGSGTDDGDSGGHENDFVGSDIEVLTGGAGDDQITAPAGSGVTIHGGAGDDTLTGAAGDDMLYGEDGADILAGGDGDDVLNGGNGDDHFDEGTATNGADVFSGGAGIDTVDYSGRLGAGVTVTMDGAHADDGTTGAGENDDVNADIEACVGSDLADVITGNALRNVIIGGKGPDILDGGDGDDTFYEGLDLASSDTDSDVIIGGNGVDTVDYSGRTHALTISLDDLADSGDQTITTPEADRLDCENATGGHGVNLMIGNAGPNQLTGGASNDTIDGGDGDDVLDGAGGNNLLVGGVGFDSCTGNGTTPKDPTCEL